MSLCRQRVQFDGMLRQGDRFGVAPRDVQEDRKRTHDVRIQRDRMPGLLLGAGPIPIGDVDQGHGRMGFAEVRVERDRLCRGGAHRPVDVRHPIKPETPQCLREPCPRRRVVRLKLNGSLEVRDRLPLLLQDDPA
jgi:hypothetical protein